MGNDLKEFFSLVFHFKMKDLFITQTKNGITQLFRTCFVGGIATLIEMGFCWLFLRVLPVFTLRDYLATALGFILSTFINFYLSRWFVFKANEARTGFAGELLGFLLLSAMGLGLKELFLFLFKLLSFSYWPAWLLATILVLLWNFLGRKFFIYKNDRDDAESGRQVGGDEFSAEDARFDLHALEAVLDYLKSEPKIEFDPYPVYPSVLQAGLGLLPTDYEYMTHWDRIKERGVEPEEMNVTEIATLLTSYNRGERFSTGHIADGVESGMLLRLFTRLYELKK